MNDSFIKSVCRLTLAILFTGFFVLDVSVCRGQVLNEDLKLLANEGAVADDFGWSIDIDDGVVAIGAPNAGQGGGGGGGSSSGAVYLFDTITGQQIHRLVPSDGQPGDYFGWYVAIDNGVVAVGSPRDGDNGPTSGSVYLFDAITGQQLHKLVASDAAADDQFGEAIAMDNGILAIGALKNDDNGTSSGSAYLFDVSSGQQLRKLLPKDGAQGDSFGSSIAIRNGVVAVGAQNDNDNGSQSGSAYLFDAITGQQLHKLLANDGAPVDRFGWSITIGDGVVAVGAIGPPGDLSGSVYIFDPTTGQQLNQLIPSDGAVGDIFGYSIAIDNGVVAVGTPNDDDNGSDSGSAYLFDASTGQQVHKLLASDGAEDDWFGSSIAIDNGIVIVGAYGDDDNGFESGSAYMFDTSASEVVVANSYLVTHGTHVSGGVVELAESDNADLSVYRAAGDMQSRTEFEVKAVSPVAIPTSLEVTLEGSVFARSTVNQTIELYDYVASVWEQIDTRAASRFTDSTVTAAATGDLSRFVEAGTVCMMARIRYQSPAARQQFSSNTDQFIWTIGQ